MIELAPFSAAWTSYTPTWTNLTVGNGTNVGAFVRVGKLVAFRAQITFGSTTSVTGGLSVSFPVTAKAANGGTFSSTFISAGNTYAPAIIYGDTGGLGLFAPSASGAYVVAVNTSSSIPFSWKSTDIIFAGGVYEAA